VGSEVLKGFPTRTAHEKQDWDDISVVEIAEWLRNRYLDEWKKNPSSFSAMLCLAHLKTVLQHQNPKVQKQLDEIYLGASRYISQKQTLP
jgi:hypothetical protein